jgi:uncharacterized protein (TIGR03067 family)
MNATLALGVVLSIGAPASKEKPKSEIDIVGEWIVVSQEIDGKPDTPIIVSMSFTADGQWGQTFVGDKAAKNCEKYVLSATAKPATLDLIFTPDTNISGVYGIVRVDGDTLKFCYGYSPKARPSKFDTTMGSGHTLVVLTRKKKD